MSMYLDHHHHLRVRPWHRLTRAEDDLTYHYKYHLKLAEIQALKEDAKRSLALDIRSLEVNGIRVRTFGECLPASGVMLWKGGGYTLVWWDGGDAPMVWPVGDLEVAE